MRLMPNSLQSSCSKSRVLAAAVSESGGSKMSRSGDLSFSYGNYSEERGSAAEHGIYLLIWRANMNGDWKLALNLQKKFPPAAKR